MKKNVIGAMVGTAGIVLWFMPLVNVQFMGYGAYQAGHHIGGIAYLLLLASGAYAALSWLELHVPRLIAAGVVTGISTLFLVQAGSAAAWGLYGLALTGAGGVILAWRDHKADRQLASPEQVPS